MVTTMATQKSKSIRGGEMKQVIETLEKYVEELKKEEDRCNARLKNLEKEEKYTLEDRNETREKINDYENAMMLLLTSQQKESGYKFGTVELTDTESIFDDAGEIKKDVLKKIKYGLDEMYKRKGRNE